MLNAQDLYNETYYLGRNPDVANAIAAGLFPTGFAHFESLGQAEGRNPTALFTYALLPLPPSPSSSLLHHHQSNIIKHLLFPNKLPQMLNHAFPNLLHRLLPILRHHLTESVHPI